MVWESPIHREYEPPNPVSTHSLISDGQSVESRPPGAASSANQRGARGSKKACLLTYWFIARIDVDLLEALWGARGALFLLLMGAQVRGFVRSRG